MIFFKFGEDHETDGPKWNKKNNTIGLVVLGIITLLKIIEEEFDEFIKTIFQIN